MVQNHATSPTPNFSVLVSVLLSAHINRLSLSRMQALSFKNIFFFFFSLHNPRNRYFFRYCPSDSSVLLGLFWAVVALLVSPLPGCSHEATLRRGVPPFPQVEVEQFDDGYKLQYDLWLLTCNISQPDSHSVSLATR